MAITICSSETGKYNFQIDDVKKIDDMVSSGNVNGAVNYAADLTGLNPNVARSLIWVESGFNPTAKSYAGAYGLGQLMPDTAKGLGVEISDPAQNMLGALVYYKGMLNATGGNYVQAYRGFMSGNPKISDSSLDSFHLQGVKNFADKLASLGITGAATSTGSSSSSSSTSDNSVQAIMTKFMDEGANIAKTYGPAMANLLNESNKIIEENKSKLNNIFKEVSSEQTDYSNKLKNPPTYEEVSKPKNGLQEFFKTFLPVALSLAAAISPGKYGYRVALASSLWNSLKAGDIQNYQIALNDWKNQMGALKEETQSKIAALQTKAQMVQNDMTLDLKSKQSELAFLQSQETAAYTALKNSEELYEKLATLDSTKEYRNLLLQLSAQRNEIEKKRVDIEAEKAANSSGKSSGSGMVTLTTTVPDYKWDSVGKKWVYAGAKTGPKTELSITKNIQSVISHATNQAADDFLNIINNTKDYPTYQSIVNKWYNPNDPNNTTDLGYVRNVLIQALKQGAASVGLGLSDESAANMAYNVLQDLMHNGVDKGSISGAFERQFVLHVLIPAYQSGHLNGLSPADEASLEELAGSKSKIESATKWTIGKYSAPPVPGYGDSSDNSGDSSDNSSGSAENSYQINRFN